MKFFVAVSILISSVAVASQSHNETHHGRFQIVQLSEFRRDQFMIDTETGQLWVRVCTDGGGNDCADYKWQRETVEGMYDPDAKPPFNPAKPYKKADKN